MRVARLTFVLGAASLLTAGTAASAQTFTEQFSDPFPAWETGWFGLNSDAYNYYCVRPCSDRGNNPAGLWLGGTGGPRTVSPIVVNFDPTFGAGITSLQLDVSGFVATNLQAFDIANNLIFDQAITLSGNVSNGVTYLITSANGISRFGFTSTGSAGNTAIDNVIVNATVTGVPEPGTWALLGTGLLIVGGAVGRRRRTHAG